MAESGPEPEHRPSYLEELHVALIVALVVICAVLGFVAWNLHPKSTGFPPVPQDLSVLVPGSGFSAYQYLIQSGDDGATFKMDTMTGKGFVPVSDTDPIAMYGGPQAVGAVALNIGPGIVFNHKKLATSDWAYIVLNPGSAQPCNRHLHYVIGTVTDPIIMTPTPAILVPPLKPGGVNVGGTVPPPDLCLHWKTDSPVNLDGPYLSARFPPIRGISTQVPYTAVRQIGDLGVGKVSRRLTIDEGITAYYSITNQPQPKIWLSSSWTWKSNDSQPMLQIAATNSSAAQHESNNAFYSGILFGVVGGAVIALITEFVVPLRHRHLRGNRQRPST